MATPYYLRQFRQRLAPQPDRDAPVATRPMDYRPTLTNTLTTANQIPLPGGVTPPIPQIPKPPVVASPLPKPKPKRNRQEKFRGLPVDPVFEAMRRQYEDELAATLSQLTTEKGQIPLMQELILTRLGRDQALANETSDEDAIARGIFRSGVRGQNLQDIDMGFGRQKADVAQSIGQQYSDLAQAEAEARLAYNRGIDQELLALAERLAQAGYNPGKR